MRSAHCDSTFNNVSRPSSMTRMLKYTACLLLMLAPGLSMAGEVRNVNFAAFQKVSPDFEFEPIVLGKFSDFITVMEGAQLLILSHTAGSINGDVINIQQDVLREGKDGLSDIGINCTLSYLDESEGEDTSFEIGGLCRIIETTDDKHLKLTAIIPMAGLPDTAQGVDAWVELYEDEETGIAFYANVSSEH